MFLLSLLLLFLCNYVVVVHLSLCIHNYRWTRTKLPSNNKNKKKKKKKKKNNNNNNNNNKKINLHKLLNFQ